MKAIDHIQFLVKDHNGHYIQISSGQFFKKELRKYKIKMIYEKNCKLV